MMLKGSPLTVRAASPPSLVSPFLLSFQSWEYQGGLIPAVTQMCWCWAWKYSAESSRW